MYFDKICISSPCLPTIVILKVENMVLTNLVKPQNNFESAEVFGYKKRVQVSSAACLQGLNCSALDRVVTIAQLRLCPQQLSSGQQ